MKKSLLILVFLAACSAQYNGGGNLKSWLQDRVKKENLELEWKMIGDYNITEDQMKAFAPMNIGQVVNFFPVTMTSQNFSDYAQWLTKKDKKPYPHPLYVVSYQCEKKIIFTEVVDPVKFNKELKNEGKCAPVSVELGLVQNAIPVTPASAPQ